MNKQGLARFAKSMRTKLSKHSPEILAGIGIAGMCTTVVLSVKATPKALELIQEAEVEKAHRENRSAIIELSKMETIKAAWKPYIPAAITGVLSITCLISSTSVNARRNAALATAYKISETALNEFRDKTVEVVGEKKVKEIKDKIAKDKVEKDPVSKNNVIITSKGETLCYDVISGRYFKSDIDKLKNAAINANHRLLSHDYISLNDLYSEMGLEGNDVGYSLGWSVFDGKIEFEFSSQLADDGTPCIVIDYNIPPKYDYDKFA